MASLKSKFAGWILDQLQAALEPRFRRIEEHLEAHSRAYEQLRAVVPPDVGHWAVHPGEGEPGSNVFPNSAPCREADFRRPYFVYWTQRLQQYLALHRKLWEFVFICQSLYERGLLADGRRGLGFGVGGEPLPALFAAFGCEILATDIAADEAAAVGWAATAQHAASLEALRRPTICAEDRFDRLVRFRPFDMNATPGDLSGFDFCWSACALEHLGSIEQGLRFIERSLDCLNPGGVAIHTTEFNVSSDTSTLDNAGTVLFRRRDLEALEKRLLAAGHDVAPLQFDPGCGVMDHFVDVPPYRLEPHLKLALQGYVSTSYGIIVRKAG